MKISELKKTFKLRPAFWVFVIVMLAYFPTALMIPPESDQFAITSVIGIDYANDNYEFSALVLTPVQSSTMTETYKVFSSKGSSVAEAIYNMEGNIGRKLGMIHTGTIVLGSGVIDDKLVKSLDSLNRSNTIGKNVVLISVGTAAKEFLLVANQMEKSTQEQLKDLVAYNEDVLYCVETSLESFYKGLLSPMSSSLISNFELIEDTNQGTDASQSSSSNQSEGGGQNGESGGGEDSSSGGASEKEKKQVIANSGTMSILKNGKKVGQLENEDIFGLSYLRNKKFGQNFTITTEVNGNETSMLFEVKSKKTSSKVRFDKDSGRPHIFYDIYIVVILKEMNSDASESEGYYINSKNSQTKEVEKLIAEKIRTDIGKTLSALSKYKCDALGLYTLCEREDDILFYEYLDTLESEDEFLKHVLYSVNIDVLVKN